jgi:hypothetical protein
MARLVIESDELVVRLSPLEKLGAARGNVRIPLRAVRNVRATDHPWQELRGMRAPGTGLPGVIALCTLRGRGFRDFAAVYKTGPAVVVDAARPPFDRVIVSCVDAAAVAERIGQALPAPPPVDV